MINNRRKWLITLVSLSLLNGLTGCANNTVKATPVGTWRSTMFDDMSSMSPEKKLAKQERFTLKEGGTGSHTFGERNTPRMNYPLTWTISGDTVSMQREKDKTSGKMRTGVLSADGRTLTVKSGDVPYKFVREGE